MPADDSTPHRNSAAANKPDRPAARHLLKNYWPSITIAVTIATIASVCLTMLWTLPPRTIAMATGPEGGFYYELGKRYRAVLAEDGVALRLVPTEGSVENLAKLRDPGWRVSVALMQGGVVSSESAVGLETLGTIFYEPCWWFTRREIKEAGFDGLRGKRISIGPEGSGTRALALELLARAGINKENSELLPLAPQDVAEKLPSGEIDAAFLVAAWQSPVVQQLFADDGVVLSGYARADALVALYPFLAKLVVPRGAADLAKDKPPSEVTLIGPKASLVVRGDLHPAIQYLLLNAAAKIHSGPGVLNKPNEFPAPEAIDLPLSNEALRFYKSGIPFLHEYFTFWVAELIGKTAILIIPLFGVLLPMIHFLPRIYNWVMRSRILRMYGELRQLEDATALGSESSDREILARIDRLEKQVNHLSIPVTYSNMLYDLRAHIDLVRDGLKKRTTMLH